MSKYFNPIDKNYHNITYMGNGSTVKDLNLFKDEINNCLYSSWKIKSIFQRIKFLFNGEITLCVVGDKLPPMSVINGDYLEEFLE